MDNNLDKNWLIGKYEFGANGAIRSNIKFNYFNYLLAVFKEDFQKHKMTTWWLGHIFGISGLLFSFLQIISTQNMVDAMPSGFRFCIYFFSLVYILFQSLRAYERYRKDRHENNKNEFLWKLEKQEHLANNKKQNK